MTEATPRFRDIFEVLREKAALPPELVRRVFESIFAGEWTPVQVAGLLVALRLKGDDADTLGAAATAMRAVMTEVHHDFPRLLDTCGTGGDGAGTLNISTGSAILVAAAGVPVAKHGNRAVSSQSGSADVLEALGVPTDVPPDRAVDVLRESNIAFLLAPAHHPAVRHASQARQELGIRTIFNAIGPLCNPARVSHQLLGAYDDTLRSLFATTLRALGLTRAWVVRGEDGLDEVSPYAATRVAELSEGTLREFAVRPEDFGIRPLAVGSAKGGDALFNAWVIEQLVRGEEHPAVDAFVLNAAAALVVVEELPPKDATARIRDTIRSGAALRTLESWRSSAQKYSGAHAAGPR